LDNKLITILKTFSKEEFKEFEKFIESPFFSSGRNLKPLYLTLKIFYPDFDSKQFTNENVFGMIYKNREFNAALMRKLISDMTKTAEEYLIQIAVRKNPYYYYVLKLIEFTEKGLVKQFEKYYSEAENYVKINPFASGEENRLLNELYDIKINNYYDRGLQNKLNDLIIQSCTYQINSFFFTLIDNLQSINANDSSFGKSERKHIINNFIENFNFDNFANASSDPKIKIYNLYMHEIKGSNDENTILELKGLLNKHKNIFHKSELYELYKGLTSMCIILKGKKSNNIEYNKLLFEIYDDALKNDVLSNPATGSIDLLRFRNVIHTALDISNTGWAEQFIKNYVKTLPQDQVKNLENFFYGMIEYSKGNYEMTIEYISKVNQSQFVFMNDLKFLYLKCYYDLNHIENAISLVSSYRHYVSYNDAIPIDHKQHIFDFLKKYLALINLKSKFTKDGFHDLERILRESEDSWLYKRLMEIKRK
jgi:hypothetical protein